MKKALLLWLFGLLLTTQIFAQQNRTITGTVKDSATGEALIGVNVTGKGTTIGTVTDIDGKYTVELPKDVNAVVFSYVGYRDMEKPVTSLTINAILSPAGQVIEEVVVSALNVQRNKGSVVYAQTTVNNEDLNRVSSKSALSALQGKVAGLNISASSGAVGASTRVVLRGETSLTGDNNALIVVDGIPVNNSTVSAGAGIDSRGNADRDNYVDFGNRGNDINPDDIETINVLKGPAATSLYGSRGSRGVILITTKKGKNLKDEKRPFKISIGSSVAFDRAYIIMQRQDKYGTGYATADGIGGSVQINTGENFSWGSPFDGVVRPWTALPANIDPNTGDILQILPLSDGTYRMATRPYKAVPNQLQSFFDIGITNKNSVSIEGGNDKYQFYASYVNTNQKGTIAYSDFKKNSVLLNANANFSEKFNANFSVNYTNIKQRGATEGGYPFGQSTTGLPSYAIALQNPVNIPFTELRDYNNPLYDLNGFPGQYSANPYFLLGETQNLNGVDNVIGKLELNYKPVQGLTLTARASTNFINNNVVEKIPQYAYHDAVSWIDGTLSSFNGNRSLGNFNNGQYKETLQRRNLLNLDVLATYQRDLGKKKLFNISVLGGLNSSDERSSRVSGQTNGGLVIPGFYNLKNSVGLPTSDNFTGTPYRLLGLLGNVSVGYKSVINLEYSARNDWSSRLAKGKNSFFYQSGGVSFRPTELFKNPNKWLTYMKIRADVGTSGNDPASQYLTETYFATNGYLINNGGLWDIRWPFNGHSGSTPSNILGNPELKPELTFSYEAGMDIGLFRDRLNIEYTYYSQNSKNQIVPINIAPSSGYAQVPINIGRITNKGHELAVRATILKAGDSWNKLVDWSIFGTFNKNDNKVVKVADGLTELTITGSIVPYSSSGTSAVVAKEGMPYGTFKVVGYQYDPQGNIVVNAQGIPLHDENNFQYINSKEKFRYTFGSDFSIKGLTAHVLFEAKVGGKFISVSRASTDFNGTAKETEFNDRHAFIVPGSVVQITDSTYAPNAVATSVYNYYSNAPSASDIIDASYLKLREVSLSYTIAGKYFKGAPISGITIGVFGRNLKYWLPKENQFADPETSGFGLNGNGQGIESQNTPSSRSYGFDFKINF